MFWLTKMGWSLVFQTFHIHADHTHLVANIIGMYLQGWHLPLSPGENTVQCDMTGSTGMLIDLSIPSQGVQDHKQPNPKIESLVVHYTHYVYILKLRLYITAYCAHRQDKCCE